MLMLSASNATFDERLIQRSGSGETDNSGSNSGLATPRDEDVQPLNATIAMDSKHAAKLEAVASSRMETKFSASVKSRKEYQGLYRVPPSLSSSSSLGAGEGRGVSRVLPAVTRMMSSGSGSSVSQSPECEDPEITYAKAKGMYSMPNRHISIEVREHEDEDAADEFRIEDFIGPTQGLDSLFNRRWTIREVGGGALRVVFFVPWCVAVGGSIVLCPKYLDGIAFHTGYLDPVHGIRRFAYWADKGFEHVAIFLALVCLVVYLRPGLGWLIVCGVGAVSGFVWWDFGIAEMRRRGVLLGDDDRMSVYLGLTRFWWAGDDVGVKLRRVEGGFVLVEDEEDDGASSSGTEVCPVDVK